VARHGLVRLGITLGHAGAALLHGRIRHPILDKGGLLTIHHDVKARMDHVSDVLAVVNLAQLVHAQDHAWHARHIHLDHVKPLLIQGHTLDQDAHVLSNRAVAQVIEGLRDAVAVRLSVLVRVLQSVVASLMIQRNLETVIGGAVGLGANQVQVNSTRGHFWGSTNQGARQAVQFFRTLEKRLQKHYKKAL